MGTGFTLFKRDGTALHFDRRKCQKSQQMGRVPTKLKWTAKYGKNA
jgi:ribosomal protein L24E